MGKKQEGTSYDYGFEDRSISGNTPNTRRVKHTGKESAGHTHAGAVKHVPHGSVHLQHNATTGGNRKQKI